MLAESGACQVVLLNDLGYSYYPLPLCLRVGSLQQSPSTLDFISLAGAYRGGIIPQAPHSFEIKTANANFLWEGVREGYLFLKKRYPSLKPSQRKFYIASEQLEELQCLPIALPSARRCRV